MRVAFVFAFVARGRGPDWVLMQLSSQQGHVTFNYLFHLY